MKVVIESLEQGVCWKLKSVSEGQTIAASLVYFPSMDDCLADLGIHARSWKKHLPERSVSTVGEVKIYTNGVYSQTLADFWPDL